MLVLRLIFKILFKDVFLFRMSGIRIMITTKISIIFLQYNFILNSLL